MVELRRLGKRLVLALEDDLFLVLHLMIAASREYASTKTASGGFRRTEEIRRLIVRLIRGSLHTNGRSGRIGLHAGRR